MSKSVIAVVGASGQLAHALRLVGERFGFTVACRGRPQLDLLSLDSQAAFLREVDPAVVVNAAAYTAVDKAEREPDVAFRVNAEGPACLATLCHSMGLPLMHVSTDYVFDGSGARAWREDDPVAPINTYGASKAAGEDAVRRAAARHIILRTSWVYGEHGANFVKTMLRLAKDRGDIGVVDDQHGCPTYAPDLAVAILAIADRIATCGEADRVWGTYHAAGSGVTSWHEFAEEIFRLAGARGHPIPHVRGIPSSAYPTPARRPANSQLDCSKLKRVFGFALPEWRASLAICVDNLLSASGETAA
jgi:dTDP-4-dehydrorhamnose reductase